jgi:hypothetical protein
MLQHIGLTGSADSRIDHWFRECKKELASLGNPKARMCILVFPSNKQAAYWAERIALGSFVDRGGIHLGGKHQPLQIKHKDEAVQAILPHPSAVAFLATMTMIQQLQDWGISYRDIPESFTDPILDIPEDEFVKATSEYWRSNKRTDPDEIPEFMWNHIGHDAMNYSKNADLLNRAINPVDPPMVPFDPEVYIFHPDGWKLPAEFNPEQDPSE